MRFAQEAKAASGLNHPNIITIYEIDQSESTSFIATEFIDGSTLRERMRAHPIPFAEVLNVAVQVATGLMAAHDNGIVHRDIKPENVIIRSDGIVKVLDFGLAKLTGQGSPDGMDGHAPTRAHLKTASGLVMGTATYMSPEQAPRTTGRCAHGHLQPGCGALRTGRRAVELRSGYARIEAARKSLVLWPRRPVVRGAHLGRLLTDLLLAQQPGASALPPDHPWRPVFHLDPRVSLQTQLIATRRTAWHVGSAQFRCSS